MSDLQVINQNGQLLIDSREVAELIGMRHSDLLEKIAGYIRYLTNGKFRSLDFFIESKYVDAKGESRPHFYLTRKGCDMVANKMTGEKGVLFTAAYVTKFEEMEKQLKVSLEGLSPILQFMIQTEMKQKALEEKQQQLETVVVNIKETFLQRDEDWRRWLNKEFAKAVMYTEHKDFQAMRNDTYKELEARARCDLKARLRNLLKRLEEQGATKTQLEKTTRLDVIEADPRLKEIYTTIIKELSLKYVPVGVGQT